MLCHCRHIGRLQQHISRYVVHSFNMTITSLSFQSLGSDQLKIKNRIPGTYHKTRNSTQHQELNRQLGIQHQEFNTRTSTQHQGLNMKLGIQQTTRNSTDNQEVNRQLGTQHKTQNQEKSKVLNLKNLTWVDFFLSLGKIISSHAFVLFVYSHSMVLIIVSLTT